jgi:tetratricopeptide (TPR) repeat protein
LRAGGRRGAGRQPFARLRLAARPIPSGGPHSARLRLAARFACSGLAAAAALLGLACATRLELGERRYREGDRLAALEIWRSVPEDSAERPRAERRIREVEAEFERLVVQYKQRARYFEERGRLAESILSYRLALALQPSDLAALDHVQELARVLAARKGELRSAYADAMAKGDLARAGADFERLRALDPLDPELETQSRQLEAALGAEIERLGRVGRAAFGAGNHAAAERAFRGVLALAPEDESARGYLSYIAAIRSAGNAAGAPPSAFDPAGFATEARIRAEGFHQNSLAAEREGDLYAAIRQELLALEVDPGHAAAREHLAGLRLRLAPELERLIEAGRSAFRNEDLYSALEAWRHALLIDPENERTRAYVARAERQLQNLERLRAEPAE